MSEGRDSYVFLQNLIESINCSMKSIADSAVLSHGTFFSQDKVKRAGDY